MRLGPFLPLGLVGAIAVAVAPGCSLGAGTGSCSGTLNLPDCWEGSYDMHPSFFAAVPSTDDDSLQIRIQNGGDYETFSDGLEILVDDAGEVRGDPSSTGAPRPSLLGMTLVVALPAGVTPSGVPVTPRARQSIVHATLYLDATCRTQNDALDAMDAVTVNADGTCLGTPAITCPDSPASTATSSASTSAADGGAATAVGTSTIVFNALFDGNEDESNASERLSDGSFHMYFADPREICPGGVGPPPPCRGELTGNFHFYFERGRPAQPFP